MEPCVWTAGRSINTHYEGILEKIFNFWAMEITLRKAERDCFTRLRIIMEGDGQKILNLSLNGVYRYYLTDPSNPFDTNPEERIREER
ncbi:hypothetical protein LCGC14_1672200 [marine sediment metagenome]|uniref:Uncharacterized protein n=1 Tax=marine sediment metagenome TaxID=412755 RepID=A0A0F9HRN7_9ZZZZ